MSLIKLTGASRRGTMGSHSLLWNHAHKYTLYTYIHSWIHTYSREWVMPLILLTGESRRGNMGSHSLLWNHVHTYTYIYIYMYIFTVVNDLCPFILTGESRRGTMGSHSLLWSHVHTYTYMYIQLYIYNLVSYVPGHKGLGYGVATMSRLLKTYPSKSCQISQENHVEGIWAVILSYGIMYIHTSCTYIYIYIHTSIHRYSCERVVSLFILTGESCRENMDSHSPEYGQSFSHMESCTFTYTFIHKYINIYCRACVMRLILTGCLLFWRENHVEGIWAVILSYEIMYIHIHIYTYIYICILSWTTCVPYHLSLII